MKINFLTRFYEAATAEQGGTAAVLAAVKELAQKSTDNTTEAKKDFEAKVVEMKSSFTTELNKVKEDSQKDIEAAKKEAKEARELIDQINKKGGTNGFSGTQTKSFSQEVGEKIGGAKWKEQWNHYKENDKRKGFAIDLEAKAVGNMASTNLTGTYFSAQQVPGIVVKPYETTHMRDILPVGQTDRDTIRYIVDNGGEGGPAMVAAGGTKPQIDRDLEIKDALVKKIATYFRIPEEMVEDIPYMQSFLTQIGVEEVMAVEDAQILTGDGTGNNLNGVYTTATAFTQAAAGVAIVTAPNEYDVIRAAQVQLQIAKFQPAVTILNPVDWYNMTSRKDTTNNYVLQGGGNGLVPQLSGLRVLIQNQIAAGTFLVGDPRTTAIFDRAGTTVRVFEQDQDNAIKNLITVVIEKRLALVNYRPSAWVKGAFGTAITDLTS